ncbi:tetratricopeptide repeat protein [Flammeovirga sp. MY04]|uniref:tetratricopeptide repeat protein n=1 Tax=Flammeovirga sp. MY04 TaxID=1191459 RepID=UPI000806147A|nr:tetratricopeptide repeat protein [Flammeovirga sp. MY04]ANQ49006.1 tetratricopeptide repeat protein [Flammeovirga sp. MY04]
MNSNNRSLLFQLFCSLFLFVFLFDVKAQKESSNSYALELIHQPEIEDPKNTLYECNLILKNDKSNYEAYFNRALAKTSLGAFKSAQLDFSKALNLNHPRKVDIYYRRGISYFLENDFLNAISDFDSAIRIEPDHVQALWKKAQAYFHLDSRVLMMETLDQLSIVQPDNPITWHDMGTLYYKNKNFDKAKDCFTKALIIDPKMSVSYNHRGVVYNKLHDAAKAFDDFNRAIFYDSCFVEAYNNRGLIYLEFEDYFEAENDFLMAIKKDNHLNKEALNNLAITKYLTGRIKEGLDDINEVLNHYPFFATAYITRGNIKERLHDDAGACSDWHKAAELGILSGLTYAQETCH